MGYYGTVFRATRREDNALCAVKVLYLAKDWERIDKALHDREAKQREEAAGFGAGKDRFGSEKAKRNTAEEELDALGEYKKNLAARTWASDLSIIQKLKHPNIVEFMDVIKESDTLSEYQHWHRQRGTLTACGVLQIS
jgi:serine/threonine protein kinase